MKDDRMFFKVRGRGIRYRIHIFWLVGTGILSYIAMIGITVWYLTHGLGVHFYPSLSWLTGVERYYVHGTIWAYVLVNTFVAGLIDSTTHNSRRKFLDLLVYGVVFVCSVIAFGLVGISDADTRPWENGEKFYQGENADFFEGGGWGMFNASLMPLKDGEVTKNSLKDLKEFMYRWPSNSRINTKEHRECYIFGRNILKEKRIFIPEIFNNKKLYEHINKKFVMKINDPELKNIIARLLEVELATGPLAIRPVVSKECTLTGQVMASNDSHVLKGVTVSAVNQKASTKTNEDGYFKLNVDQDKFILEFRKSRYFVLNYRINMTLKNSVLPLGIIYLDPLENVFDMVAWSKHVAKTLIRRIQEKEEKEYKKICLGVVVCSHEGKCVRKSEAIATFLANSISSIKDSPVKVVTLDKKTKKSIDDYIAESFSSDNVSKFDPKTVPELGQVKLAHAILVVRISPPDSTGKHTTEINTINIAERTYMNYLSFKAYLQSKALENFIGKILHSFIVVTRQDWNNYTNSVMFTGRLNEYVHSISPDEGIKYANFLSRNNNEYLYRLPTKQDLDQCEFNNLPELTSTMKNAVYILCVSDDSDGNRFYRYFKKTGVVYGPLPDNHERFDWAVVLLKQYKY